MTRADRVNHHLSTRPRHERALTRLRGERTTSAWLPAVCVLAALATAPGLAHAGEHASAQPPTLPSESKPEPSATTAAPTTAAPVASPSDGAAAPSVPAPNVDRSLSLHGTIIWDGLEDKQVQLTMADGTLVRGTVVTNSATAIALARAGDGMVVSVPKAEVEAIKMRTPPPTMSAGGGGPQAGNRPTQSGRGMRGGGVAMVTMGAISALGGTIALGACPGCLYIHLPLLLPGVGLIIGGSVALKRSKRRDEEFRKAWGIPIAGRMKMTPNVGMSRNGGQVGFTLEF